MLFVVLEDSKGPFISLFLAKRTKAIFIIRHVRMGWRVQVLARIEDGKGTTFFFFSFMRFPSVPLSHF